MKPESLASYLSQIFRGRTDCYLRLDGDKPWKDESEVTLNVFLQHLRGRRRIGIYPNEATSYMCFDFDGKNLGVGGKDKALGQALKVQRELQGGLIELTRSEKGYHLWLLFNMPYPLAPEVKAFGKAVLHACDLPYDEDEKKGHPGIYPHLGTGGQGLGKAPFLPLFGIYNGCSNSYFVDILGQRFEDQIQALRDVPRVDFYPLLANYSFFLDELEKERTNKRARSYLLGADNREGKVSSRHAFILQFAMRLRNHFPKETTRMLVEALGKNAGLQDENRMDEVERAIESAYLKPAIQVKTQFDIEQEVGAELYELITQDLKEIKEMKDVELDYLVEGLLLPGEAVLMASPPGAGKSMLSIALAVAAAAGKPVFGEFAVTDPLKVVYVNEEMNVREFNKRVKKIAAGLDVDIEQLQGRLLIFPQQGLTLNSKNAIALNTFKERVLEFQPQLVILDTFIALFGGEEKDAGEIRQWYNQVVVWLRHNTGAAVIVQHHVRKPPEDFKFKECDDTTLMFIVRGSSDLPGAFERLLVLWKTADQPNEYGRIVTLGVRNPKARSGDKVEPFEVVICDEDHTKTALLASQGIKSPQAAQSDARIKALLQEAGGEIEKNELLTKLKEFSDSDRTTRRWLSGAIKRKICTQKGHLICKN